ncbi:MAG TPA: magnesium/cobalt transporter CorA [Acidimicrobiales bacterium]|nr:magnesium/cobalt transporter CorA [Acidimicrobiales bacterium]
MIVDCGVYEHGARLPDPATIREALKTACDRPDAFVWVGLHEPDFEEFDEIQEIFDLHPLAVEDAVHAHQRPKVERYGETLFVVLIPARYVDPEEVVELGELMLFIGDSFVVTVRHGPASGLAETRRDLELDPERLRNGPMSVLHGVMDKVVDDYHLVIAGLETDIDEIESAVFSTDRQNHAERIFKLKREVLDFRRGVRPLVEPLADFADDGVLDAYFRDVHDHVLRVAERVDAYEALLTSALNANLAQVGVRQNEDMRKISAWVAILAVPTMVAGIYGMNFDHMPELQWRYGYYGVLGVMVTACVGLFFFFRRRGWL